MENTEPMVRILEAKPQRVTTVQEMREYLEPLIGECKISPVTCQMIWEDGDGYIRIKPSI